MREGKEGCCYFRNPGQLQRLPQCALNLRIGLVFSFLGDFGSAVVVYFCLGSVVVFRVRHALTSVQSLPTYVCQLTQLPKGGGGGLMSRMSRMLPTNVSAIVNLHRKLFLHRKLILPR